MFAEGSDEGIESTVFNTKACRRNSEMTINCEQSRATFLFHLIEECSGSIDGHVTVGRAIASSGEKSKDLAHLSRVDRCEAPIFHLNEQCRCSNETLLCEEYLAKEIECLGEVTISGTDTDDHLIAEQIWSDTFLVHHFVVEVMERLLNLREIVGRVV